MLFAAFSMLSTIVPTTAMTSHISTVLRLAMAIELVR